MNYPDPTPFALNDELPDNAATTAARLLPAGSRLGEFEIEEILHQGNVAVAYAATDRALALPVVISEYMPARLASRDAEGQITPRAPVQTAVFADGLAAFIDETRALARCDHPSLVRILRLWKANATAYRVMPRYHGKRLLDVRRDMNEPPDEGSLRALLDALLGALEAFHREGGGHGKVTPSNILLLDDNRPLLLGPGATARAVASDRIDVLMTSAEPCFAPIEQIVETDRPLQPSVDLYALAGVARYWISGQLPAPSLDALEVARPEKLADTGQRICVTWPKLQYSAALLDALDSALSIYPAERPQSVAEMRARLDAVSPVARRHISAAEPADPVLDGAAPSTATTEPLPSPHVEQDLHFITAPAADADVLEPSIYAGFDHDAPVRMAVSRQAKSRRIATWSGALVTLLALGIIATQEFGQHRQLARALQALGIGRGPADTAAVASVERPAPPSRSVIAANVGGDNGGAGNARAAHEPAADAESTKSMPTVPAAANPASEAIAPAQTGSTSADVSASAVAPATVAPATVAPATVAPATVAPATVAPATVAPATVAPATVAPATVAPAAVAPATIASATVASTPAASSPAVRAIDQSTLTVTPASPREACGTRTQFALYRCMQTQCSQPQWASHAQCEHLRATDSAE